MRYLPYILMLWQVELCAQYQVEISSDQVCAGNLTTLNASSNIDESLIQSYTWDLDGNGYFNDAEGKIVEHNFQSADTFLVMVRILTVDEETYTSLPSEVIINPNPVADFYAKNTCRGDTAIFMNLSYVNNRELTSYRWDFNNDNITDSESKDTKYLLKNTLSDISLEVVSEDGCENSIEKEVRLFEKPVSDFTFVNSCMKDTISFSNLSTISSDTILYSIWNFGDKNQNISENTEHAYLDAGTFNVKLINITSNNCSDSLIKSIEIYELPEAEIIATDTILFPKDEQNLTVETNASAISWSTGSSDQTISVYSDGVYSVTVEDLNHCKNSDTIIIHKLSINEKVIKSEILTPNGDGINDILEIKEIFRHFQCQVFVYDEWGVQVFNNPDYQNDWNCEYNGKILATGAYYYLIKFDGHNFRGCVNILR